MNWRKRKKLWKRSNAWMRRNGSNKSLHTFRRAALAILARAHRVPAWSRTPHGI